MITILIRTFIVYTLLIGALRLMGKRQIGELEVSDLVSTLLLSEIAALPIENREIPISYAIIPIITVMTIEIVSSAIPVRFPNLKNIFSARPGVLVRMGKPDTNELIRSRMSFDELMVALRRGGCFDISEVAYAILEQDGSVSVIPQAPYRPATATDVGVTSAETGLFRIVIERGCVNKNTLSVLGLDREWLDGALGQAGADREAVVLMLAAENGEMRIFTSDDAPEDMI